MHRSSVVFLGKEQVRLDVLQERVRQKMETTADKEVYLRGDATVQYQDLMNVIDGLKAAGVQNIGMVARMPERALMDVTDVLRDRMQTPAGLQTDDLGVGRRAPRGGGCR